MLIIPAIDLLDGKCVRLKQGVESTAKVYDADPVAAALRWQEQGAKLLHVVNLDGAFGRARKNATAIEKILRTVDVPIELGGGIRSVSDAESWVSLGISQIILGSVAVTQPEIVRQAVSVIGMDKITVGIDARRGRVTIDGWTVQTKTDAFDLARKMIEYGVGRFVYTDVLRDGESQGPNIEATLAFAAAVQAKVIGSGGFSAVEHFQALAAKNNPYIEGAIVGTALYEGRLQLGALVEQFA